MVMFLAKRVALSMSLFQTLDENFICTSGYTLDFGKFISGSLLSSNYQIIFCNCETSSSHHKMKKLILFIGGVLC